MFSTPLNDKLFLAGVFRKPISVNSVKFSKAGFNGFFIPHNKVDKWDTQFKNFSKQELAKLNFFPQNVILNQDNEVTFNPGPISPHRMNLEFEETVPVQFSPIMSPASPISPIMSPASQDDADDTWDTLDYERTFRANF